MNKSCEFISFEQIKALEQFADRLLNKVGIDIEFTRHFGERMSDSRNNPCIKISELKDLFERIHAKSKKVKKDVKRVVKHGDDQAVLVDIQKDLNLPVVFDFDRSGKLIVTTKTIMRKKNFKTPNDKIRVETKLDTFKDYISEGRKGQNSDSDEGSNHIVMQIRKSITMGGQKDVKFGDGKSMKVSQDDARKFLQKYSTAKPNEKMEMQKKATSSYEGFKEVIGESFDTYKNTPEVVKKAAISYGKLVDSGQKNNKKLVQKIAKSFDVPSTVFVPYYHKMNEGIVDTVKKKAKETKKKVDKKLKSVDRKLAKFGRELTYNHAKNMREQRSFMGSEKDMEKLEKGVKAPFVTVRMSRLGGDASYNVNVSLDEKSTWPNGIFQNSNYAQFMIRRDDNKMEMISKNYKIKTKFRKSKWKTVDDVVSKINKWIEQAKSSMNEETLDEKELTSNETKKKEEIVKSMKDKEAEFKRRYGDNWKAVMYATATKSAKRVAEAKTSPLARLKKFDKTRAAVGKKPIFSDNEKKKEDKKEVKEEATSFPIKVNLEKGYFGNMQKKTVEVQGKTLTGRVREPRFVMDQAKKSEQIKKLKKEGWRVVSASAPRS